MWIVVVVVIVFLFDVAVEVFVEVFALERGVRGLLSLCGQLERDLESRRARGRCLHWRRREGEESSSRLDC
jgi:hypothetical protein